MAKVYEELDEAKAEIEKLKAELRIKTDSLENLKRSLNAQVNQTQEAKSKAEKLDQDLLQKVDEIVEAKNLCADLKGKLKEKESIIKHLSTANDKLKLDCDEKLKNWDDEKRELVLALEEANDKAENQGQLIYQYKQEIENLKGCLSVSKQTCLDATKNLKASKDVRERDDMFYKLEEEKRKVEDQLKWKKEQFKYLEEAYEKVKEQFKSSKKEWEMEKSTLLDEISSLQIKLEYQIRISDDLKYQLQNCHQALAHVESQKRRLEVEVSDFKKQLEYSSSENHGARLQLDCLNSDRDNNIADLRYSLKTKEAHIKESKYRIEKLEQENKELMMSLKELQEAQIQEAGAMYSQSKLRSKLRNLEQTHKECALTLKAKEAEWNSQMEQLTGDLNSCQSELEAKIAAVNELETLKAKEAESNSRIEKVTRDLNSCQSELEAKTVSVKELEIELERSHSLTIEMSLLNEEMSVMLLVLKQGISEAQLKFFNHKEDMDLINKESAEKILELMKHLEMKDAALIRAEKGVNEECKIAACLLREVESNKELRDSLQNELDRHKEMLEESTVRQKILKEKVLQMECDLKEQQKEVQEALDIAIVELDERIYERNELEFELQIWKSIAERLKHDLEENHMVRKELETSLLAQVDVGESLKQENRNLHENATRLSFERENMLVFVQGVCDKIYEFSNADTQLRDMLRSMEQSFEIDCPAMNLKKDDSFFVKENMVIQVSPTSIKKVEATSEIRSPFKELNS